MTRSLPGFPEEGGNPAVRIGIVVGLGIHALIIVACAIALATWIFT